MPIELFGFQIGKKEDTKPSVPSFVPPSNEDGTIAVNEGGAYGTTVDIDGQAKTEAHLISRYRDMAQQPECERAIDDIVNESIITDSEDTPVEIVLDKLEKLDETIKDRIRDEFENIKYLLDFNNKAYDIYKNWYVDGRLFYHIMIDEKSPRKGIQELRYIDPRKIKKVRVEKRRRDSNPSNSIIGKKYDEYFIYSSKGVSVGNQGLKISLDSICYCHSGQLNTNNSMVVSHLQKAIKPLNQLRMLEDATVIYRLARAPERRIFYIDVGNLPKAKAEQYLRDMMLKHKNKLVYDANTGEVRDDRKFLTMLEDYWLPRREGGKGTEISTLPGGQNLGEIEDVLYFRKKLYESLNVPISRLESESQFNIGRASEITRDEIKFSKFVNRLRWKFSELFHILLEKQLVLKGIITQREWQDIKHDIYYDFLKDNHFTEMKDAEIMRERLNTLRDLDEYVGRYYSVDWVRKNILMQKEEEIEEIDKQIEAEADEMPDEEPPE
jgi:hypothetical protein